MEKLICTSCKTDISVVKNSTKFPCPNCSNVRIIRCGKCRKESIEYVCSDCGFIGP